MNIGEGSTFVGEAEGCIADILLLRLRGEPFQEILRFALNDMLRLRSE